VAIHFYCDDGLEYKITSKRILKSWIKDCIISSGYIPGDINCIVTSDSGLLKLNLEYLNRNYLTDVITFDYVKGKIISGDIFLSIDRIKENSKIFNCTVQEEMYRVIIHGVLHLLGYNDSNDEEKANMRLAEDNFLRKLIII
jgi:probable rRNA maturation factor